MSKHNDEIGKRTTLVSGEADEAVDSLQGSDPLADPPQLLSAGQMVDHFEVTKLLGRGGMGEVYLAQDTKLGRKVALKLVLSSALTSKNALERFLFEARTTARFSHPNIVTVYAVGEHEGCPYLALEYLPGQTLRDRMNESRLGPREVARIGLAIAEALAEAHRHGVLHRDLKPENVLVPPEGRLRVVDFGLARQVAAPEEPTAEAETGEMAIDPDAPLQGFTTRGGFRGTPAYGAPEQWMGKPFDQAVDVWALGIILYELVARRHPYTDLGLSDLRSALLSPEPVPPMGVTEAAPAPIAKLIEACLDKSPARRPAAVEVAAQLKEFLRLGSTPLNEGQRQSSGTVSGEAQSNPSDVEDPSTHRTAHSSTASDSEISGTPLQGQRRRLGWIAVGLGIAIVAAGLELHERLDDGPSTTPPGAAPSRASSTASSPKGQAIPVYGGTLRMGYVDKVDAISPYTTIKGTASDIGQVVYEPLFRTTQHGETLPWVTTLAYDSADRRRFTLTLREGLMFHPHPCFPEERARPARAADLMASLHRVAAVNWLFLPIRGLAAYRTGESATISGITALDERRVSVQLSHRSVYTENRLTWIMLTPEHDSNCTKEAAKEPSGTGPFQLTEHSAHGRVELSRFDLYWHHKAENRPLPYLDRLIWQPLDTPRAAVAMVTRGELDAVYLRWSTDTSAVIEFSDSGAVTLGESLKSEALRVGALSWNTQKLYAALVLPTRGPYVEPKVTIALSLALDRAPVTAQIEFIDQPWARFLNPLWLGYTPLISPLSYNPERARQLLAEAGYPEGVGLPELIVGYRKALYDGASEVARQLLALGIPARAVPVDEFKLGFENMSSSIAQLVRMEMGNSGDELTDLLIDIDAELARSVQAEPNRELRGELYQQVERAHLAAPSIIPLGYNRNPGLLGVLIYRAALRNAFDPVTGSPLGEMTDIHHPGSWYSELYLAPDG